MNNVLNISIGNLECSVKEEKRRDRVKLKLYLKLKSAAVAHETLYCLTFRCLLVLILVRLRTVPGDSWGVWQTRVFEA